MKQNRYGKSSTQQFSDLPVMPEPNSNSKSILCNELANMQEQGLKGALTQ